MIASAAWARSAMSNWLGLSMISRQARVNADRRLRAYSALGRLSGMGLGHGRFGARPCFAQTVRLGHRAQRPYPSKVEGNVTFFIALTLCAVPALPVSITIRSLSCRLRPEAEKFAAPVRSNLPSI